MIPWQRKFLRVTCLVLGIIFLVPLFCRVTSFIDSKGAALWATRNAEGLDTRCTNDTLGFHKILVVSTGSSPRLEGIQQAAKFTKLTIEIPYQPDWSDEEVDNFRGFEIKGRNTEIGRGQTKCWLGHLNVLREIISQKWTTALIMEDDADWDIAIKEQMSLVAPLVREVSMTKDAGESHYGDSWDLLWLGHCGDAFPAQVKTAFIDRTLPVSPLYRENDGKYTRFPTQLRMVYKSDGPICTYAYAVTADAASKIYKLSEQGKDRLITTELREWCQSGVLRCITVNPELFHHHKQTGQVSSEIAVVEGWKDRALPSLVDYTPNIRYSARCNSRSSRLVSCQSEFGNGDNLI